MLNRWWEDCDNQGCRFFLFLSCGNDGGCFPRRDVFSGSLIKPHDIFNCAAAGNNKVPVCVSWVTRRSRCSSLRDSECADVARVRTKKAEQQSSAIKQPFYCLEITALHLCDTKMPWSRNTLVDFLNECATLYKDQGPHDPLAMFRLGVGMEWNGMENYSTSNPKGYNSINHD